MEVSTTIRTLKKVYQLFKDAGIGGLLTGDGQTVSAALVMDNLIEGGVLVDTMIAITGSDLYICEDGSAQDWEDVPYSQINEVLMRFFAGIGSVSALARR